MGERAVRRGARHFWPASVWNIEMMRIWPTPNGFVGAISAPGLFRSRASPGVVLLRGVGAPVEFEFDKHEELPGCGWSAQLLDLQ